MDELSIFDSNIKNCVTSLASTIRAERNKALKPLETYAEPALIDRFMNVTNQVIFGRRGTGKTHLLLAIKEKIEQNFINNSTIPVYIDLSKVIPVLEESVENKIEYCLLIIQAVMDEVINCVIENVKGVYKLNIFGNESSAEKAKKQQFIDLLEVFNKELVSGREIKTLGKYKFSNEDVNNINSSLSISAAPKLDVGLSKQAKSSSSDESIKYVSVADLHKLVKQFSAIIPGLQIMLLLDEFSEVNREIQPYLAALIKRLVIS